MFAQGDFERRTTFLQRISDNETRMQIFVDGAAGTKLEWCAFHIGALYLVCVKQAHVVHKKMILLGYK